MNISTSPISASHVHAARRAAEQALRFQAAAKYEMDMIGAEAIPAGSPAPTSDYLAAEARYQAAREDHRTKRAHLIALVAELDRRELDRYSGSQERRFDADERA